MNKYNTIFGQMLDFISRSHFEKLVKEYKTEQGAKGLRSWTQFIAMLFGQISGQHGLRSIEHGMNSQKNSWYHIGITSVEREVKRSTLSYANTHRDAGLFEALFKSLVIQAQSIPDKHSFKFKNPLYSIDSTVIDLCLKLFPWADFRKEKGGIKLTIKLDHQGKIPCFAVVTDAREHDTKGIKKVPYNPGDVFVFDRGYVDYAYFESLCMEKVWFVTRLKKNAVFRYGEKRSVTEGRNVMSDYEITIPSLSQKIKLRKIIVRDPETNKKIVLLTHQITLSLTSILNPLIHKK